MVYRKSIISGVGTDNSSAAYYASILNRILLTDKYVYVPLPNTKDRLSFTTIVRDEFRLKQEVEQQDRIETGFAIVRRFSSLWSFYLSLNQRNVHNIYKNESEKSQDISTIHKLTVKLTNNLKPGSILLAHPMIDGPLKRSVILVIQNENQGTYGLVLNRPSNYDLKISVKGLSKKLLKLFSKNLVNFGGMVKRLQIIHTFENCNGLEIPNCSTNGRQYYAGGDIEKIIELIESMDIEQLQLFLDENIKFYVGCCAWSAGQLQKEYDAGYWIPVDTYTDQIIDGVNKKFTQSNNYNNENNNEEEEEEAVEEESNNEIDNNLNHHNDKNIIINNLTTENLSNITNSNQNNILKDKIHKQHKTKSNTNDDEYFDETASITTVIGDFDIDSEIKIQKTKTTTISNNDNNEASINNDYLEKSSAHHFNNNIWDDMLQQLQLHNDSSISVTNGDSASNNTNNSILSDETEIKSLLNLPIWIDISSVDSVDWS